jgi:O-antigen ligase
MDDMQTFSSSYEKGFSLKKSDSFNMDQKNEEVDRIRSVNKLFRIVLAVITFIIPWAFTSLTYEFFEITKNSIFIIGVVLLLVLWAIKILIKKKMTFIRTPFDIPILVYLLSQILATILSISKETSVWGYYSRMTGGLISTCALVSLFYIVVNNVTQQKDFKNILKTIYISTTLLALFTVLNSFGVLNSWFESIVASMPSLGFISMPEFSPIGYVNNISLVLIFTLPITLAFFTESSNKKTSKAIFQVLALCIFLFAISITSVSDLKIYNILLWISILVTIILCILKKIPSDKGLILKSLPIFAVTGFFSILAFFPSLSSDLYSKVTFSENTEASFDTSWSVANGVLDEYKVKGFLFGTGPDTYAYNFPRFRPIEQNLQPNWHQNYTRSSNQILDTFANSGFLGLFSYILLYISFFVFLIKQIKQQKLNLKSKYFFGLLLSLLAIFILNFIGFFTVTLLFLLWIILGLFVVFYNIENKNKIQRLEFSFIMSKSKVAVDSERDIIPYVFSIIAIIVFIISSVFITKNFTSEVQYKRALEAITSDNLNSANDNLVGAIGKFDKRDYYHTQLAYVSLLKFKDLMGQVVEGETDINQNELTYWENLIDSELGIARGINDLNPETWSAAAILFKQKVDLSSGRLYGDETLYAASQAIRLDPFNPDNYIILGYIYKYNSDEELRNKAEEVFVRAYNLRPDYPLSIFSLGSYFELAQEYDKAIALYQNSVTNYYSQESSIREALEIRLQEAINLKSGEESQEVSPTEDEITKEVEESVIGQ